MRNGVERSVAQIKNQWGTLKSAEKRLISTERKERFETGGSLPPREEPTSSNSIRAWLPQEFETDNNEFDLDSVNQILTAPVVVSTSVPVVQIKEATPPAVEPSLAPHARPAQEVMSSRFKTKKRKIYQPSGQVASDIAANEIKCRNELHKIQLENEERTKDNEVKKKIILDLKELNILKVK